MAYKLVLRGRGDQQVISNVVYLAEGSGGGEEFSPVEMSAVATEWWETVSPALLPTLCNDYTAEAIDVTVVDGGNRTTSPFIVSVPVTGTGTAFGEPFTQGACYITGFYGFPLAGALGGRVRSGATLPWGLWPSRTRHARASCSSRGLSARLWSPS